jgi:hypothetical protein
MRYRLSKIEATRPPATYALQLVRPALGFSFSRSTSSRQVCSNPRIPTGAGPLAKNTNCLMISQAQELMRHAK